jgi:hypothetical protein
VVEMSRVGLAHFPRSARCVDAGIGKRSLSASFRRDGE